MLVLRNMFGVPACLGMFQHVLACSSVPAFNTCHKSTQPPTPHLTPYNSGEILNLAMTYLTSESSFYGAAEGLWFFSMTSAGDSIETEQITFLHYLLTGAS